MCGVVGFACKKVLFSKKNLDQCLENIAHRGPDYMQGMVYNGGKVGIGHARLSILDPDKRSHQPMSLGEHILAFNGEIYNHLDLRQTLSHMFKTTSDTETLLAGLKERGLSFLSECRGMFAGCFYNGSSNELHIFRDSSGIKNLYYSVSEGVVCFSSEIKGLTNLFKEINKKLVINKEVLLQYLTYENYEAGKTIFKDILTLKPGEVISLNSELMMEQSFFYTKVNEVNDVKDPVTTGRSIIEDSVKNHLISDFPVGVYLSGGIDSSLVASLASKNKANVKAFTGYFDTGDSYYDERPYSRIVAEYLKIPLKEIPITSQDFEKYFDSVVYHLETPKMGMGSFSQFIVAKEASKERKVILAGHGGDELFAGYSMFKAFWFAENRWTMPRFSYKEIPWVAFFLFNLLVKKTVCFAPRIFSFAKNKNLPFLSGGKPSLDDLTNYFKNTYIPGLLDVEDKISMAHSLETRVPLWDQFVISFASSVSVERKMQNGNLKSLLKEIAKPYLPEELLTAPKRGFPTPLKKWFKNELNDFVIDRICRDSKVLDIVMTNKKRVRLCKSLKLPLPYAFDEIRAHKIWMLLNLESIERQFEVIVE